MCFTRCHFTTVKHRFKTIFGTVEQPKTTTTYAGASRLNNG